MRILLRNLIVVILSKSSYNYYFKNDANTIGTFIVTAMTSMSMSTSNSGNNNNIARLRKVFCFGDSLTAGTSPPNERELFPYATHLEDKLRTSTSTTPSTTIVRWRGFPGWTASTLRDDGGLGTYIDNLLEKQQQPTNNNNNININTNTGENSSNNNSNNNKKEQPPLDLVIILAGTNDLVYEDNSEVIFHAIQDIHKIAHARGCPTIALAIPPSRVWHIGQDEKYNSIAMEVNEQLQAWCGSNCDGGNAGAGDEKKTTIAIKSMMATYVPFPIKEFDSNSRDTDLWSPDGLHFSPKGYKFVGESLAPIVDNILSL